MKRRRVRTFLPSDELENQEHETGKAIQGNQESIAHPAEPDPLIGTVRRTRNRLAGKAGRPIEAGLDARALSPVACHTQRSGNRRSAQVPQGSPRCEFGNRRGFSSARPATEQTRRDRSTRAVQPRSRATRSSRTGNDASTKTTRSQRRSQPASKRMAASSTTAQAIPRDLLTLDGGLEPAVPSRDAPSPPDLALPDRQT